VADVIARIVRVLAIIAVPAAAFGEVVTRFLVVGSHVEIQQHLGNISRY
jgi:hypothetical protein